MRRSPTRTSALTLSGTCDNPSRGVAYGGLVKQATEALPKAARRSPVTNHAKGDLDDIRSHAPIRPPGVVRRLRGGRRSLCGCRDACRAQTSEGLEEVVVTAQRRETSLQTTAVAITAFSGEKLAEDKIFTVSDLANSVPSFSFTANTPLDVELNIRGITNTRLDSPTADPSVGTFVDGVYIGRTGDYNFDFYDLERIEVIRGPQGVLLGKNVVGGALSIITAAPKFENSGEAMLSFGNYDAITAAGHVTGGLTDDVAGRAVVPGAQAQRLRSRRAAQS